MAKQRLCRICHKYPVWTHGDVKDTQDTCKRCYHKHIWPRRPASRRDQGATEADALGSRAFWEMGMEAEIKALGGELHPYDLWEGGQGQPLTMATSGPAMRHDPRGGERGAMRTRYR